MDLRNFYTTKCGGRIVLTHKACEHLRAHPEVGELMAEAIGRLELPIDGSFLAAEVDLGRVIGRSGCVPTEPIETITPTLFAQRVGRDKPTRVVVGIEGPETTKLVVLAFAGREPGTYVLVSSWIGELAEKEPWDRSIRSQEEADRAVGFWTTHGLVHDPAVMGEPFESTWEEILNS